MKLQTLHTHVIPLVPFATDALAANPARNSECTTEEDTVPLFESEFLEMTTVQDGASPAPREEGTSPELAQAVLPEPALLHPPQGVTPLGTKEGGKTAALSAQKVTIQLFSPGESTDQVQIENRMVPADLPAKIPVFNSVPLQMPVDAKTDKIVAGFVSSQPISLSPEHATAFKLNGSNIVFADPFVDSFALVNLAPREIAGVFSTPLSTNMGIPTIKPGSSEKGAVLEPVIRAITSGKSDVITVNLSPPELGRVSISLSGNDTSMSAIVSVEKPEVLDVLRRHADVLADELRNAGFSQLNLSFSRQEQGRPDAAPEEVVFVESDMVETAKTPLPPQSDTDKLDIRV